MKIRLATTTDAEWLTELSIVTMREAFGPPYNPMEVVDAYITENLNLSIIKQELADRRSTFLLASTEGDIPIGYAKLRQHAPPRRMTERCAIEIQRIYLLQSETGRGQGRALMDYCLAFATQNGYRAVWLGVWEHNTRALGFYQKMGFLPVGWHYFQFGPDRQRDIWMWKRLSE